MTVEPTRRFLRDVRGIGSAQIRRRLDQAIQQLIEADNITEVAGVSRLRAEGQHYRIRIGDLPSGHHNGRRDSRAAPFPAPGRNLPLLSVSADARGGVLQSAGCSLSAPNRRPATGRCATTVLVVNHPLLAPVWHHCRISSVEHVLPAPVPPHGGWSCGSRRQGRILSKAYGPFANCCPGPAGKT